MDSAAILTLFALLIAFAGDAAASCRKIENVNMLEYFCEGGHPVDLTTVPETTEKLRIVRMPLRRITADTFSKFGRNLWVLSCSYCEISDIDADAFRHLVDLQQLSLNNNRLTEVKGSWFEGLDSLTYLDLNYNNIRDIEDSVYRNLPSLVDLRISGNHLRCLNLDEMTHLTELKRIFLGENSEFICPYAVSQFLENQGVVFEQDPEWRRLASDMIDVHVPPVPEEKSKTRPIYDENLHPPGRPSSGESEEFYGSRERPFHSDYSAEHRSRHRRPPTTTPRPTTPKQTERLPVPRVEPVYPVTDTRPSYAPSEPSSHQVMPHPTEAPQVPPLEDIRMSEPRPHVRPEQILTYPPTMYETPPPWYTTPETSLDVKDRSRLSKVRLEEMLPYSPTMYETTPYWRPMPERPRAPPVTSTPSWEDIRMAGTDRPSQTERTYPPHISTYETTIYDAYPTSERPQVKSRGRVSSEDEVRGESGRPQSITITFPLYTTDGPERIMSHGSIQMTHSSDDSGMIALGGWSTDDPYRTQNLERHEQSRPAEENDRRTYTPDPQKTPYYGHDPRELIVEESSMRKDNDDDDDDLSVATDRSQAQVPTTSPGPAMHRIRPSPSVLMHSSGTDEFYRTHYDSSVTVHTPLQRYQANETIPGVRPVEMTQKPSTECPKNSGLKTQPVVGLAALIVVAVLGHVVMGF
ncbi:uncharacterized protein LOC105422638 [Pogonomyrmex barbatus]|uniref:Uncharacterized protein LOC105422638 n=1 Tax=Pogonomyrmex barbatus TaxID=144034 RepID=A0A6I9VUH5_9HYME|nr:uncharacterized protein LOC105422638 [Pogonomyrmex barbatus]